MAHRARKLVPTWALVLAIAAGIAWAVGVPVAAALLQDYSRWSVTRSAEPAAMPSWLVGRDAHTPTSAEYALPSSLVRRYERQATTTWRNGQYRMFYEEIQFGWPFKSLMVGSVGARHVSGTPPATVSEFVAILDGRVGWRKGLVLGRGSWGSPKALPLAPRWGLLANVLLVCVPLLQVVAGLRWKTMRRRLAAGRCPDCGYEGAATAGSCSECGWGIAASPA
ncbi:MAG: hypothetical protein RIE77_05430 [Phycisphaerales bacterium]